MRSSTSGTGRPVLQRSRTLSSGAGCAPGGSCASATIGPVSDMP